MFEKKCYNGGTKHKFSPRYTEEPTGVYPNKMIYVSEIERVRELMIRRVYVCDICKWCGKRIDWSK